MVLVINRKLKSESDTSLSCSGVKIMSVSFPVRRASLYLNVYKNTTELQHVITPFANNTKTRANDDVT